MPHIFVKSDGHVLLPISRAAAMEVENLPRGVPLKIEPKQPRNTKQHNLFYQFATYTADCANDGPLGGDWDQKRAVDRFKMATGHCELVRLPKFLRELHQTETSIHTRSISFANMDNVEFSRLMTRSLMYVRDELAPWIEDSDHWPDVQKILAESGMMEGVR